MSEENVDRNRLLFPSLAPLYQTGSPFAYSFMRFSTGAVLVPHGVDKLLHHFPPSSAFIAAHGLPFPAVLAWAVLFSESFAAAFLAIGFLTRFCAATIWIEMAVIIVFYQWQFGYFWTQKGIEFALLWLLLCTAIFFRGGGRYSVDYYLGREI